MSKEIRGVRLDSLRDPIHVALRTYEEISKGDLSFDKPTASNLDLTPTKPNSARSETEARFRGNLIGSLFVIAFKPGDGTGSEADRRLENLRLNPEYPRGVQVVPRNKTGVHSEGHLTVLTQTTDDANAEPELFAGSFDLLGFQGIKVAKIGELGHPKEQDVFTPLTTLTVGYRDAKRFGDPHAVYSSIPASLQVCAFLALTEAVQKQYEDVLNSLSPQLPRGLKS